MNVSVLYFAFLSLPVFLLAAWADYKTGKIDVRAFFFLKGLAYAAFFANDKTIILAIAVSISLVLLQFFLGRLKLPVVGSGDFPAFHAYNLIVMLFAPTFLFFAGFFIVPLIFFGLWNWLFKNRAFVPAIAFGLCLFFWVTLFFAP